MEKRTLLEIHNDVAVSLDYEEVSTLGETPESDQVARIIRNEYSKLMDRLDWPHLKIVTELNGLGDTARPNFMEVPSTVAMITDIRYDVTKVGDPNQIISKIKFYENPDDFLNKVYSRNTSDSNVVVYNTAEGIPIWTINDQPPTFCTTFDDNILIFDSFDNLTESTLQGSKSIVRALKGSAWVEDDNFTPDIPVNLFSTFVSKCKLVANEQLRQVTLRTEGRDFQIGLNHASRQIRIKNSVRKPNYGRR